METFLSILFWNNLTNSLQFHLKLNLFCVKWFRAVTPGEKGKIYIELQTWNWLECNMKDTCSPDVLYYGKSRLQWEIAMLILLAISMHAVHCLRS